MATEQTATVLEWTRLRDEVCEQLRDRIIAGQFEPGHRLVERDLAEQFGVSRIPVREAIQTLITEGFVEVLSPRKIVVKRVSRRDVEELFGVREALETYAAREATLRADAAELRTLERLVEKARRATLSGHPDRISRANSEFHRHIIEMAGNQLLADLLRPLEGRLRWLFQQIDNPGHLWCEHRALYEAIAAGDADVAADHALRHVRENRGVALKILFGEDQIL
ncbi:GntR family transcriptional regulator [Nocardia macrotermitis]|uniref:GntR family transcriptional regulator n=1 Tax=Nocardia macrotermitis TaxID=2585198 RepID=UPI0029E81311|nr:GntR family transcriptional regulator [Nocardia macrotermitis]